MSRMVYLRETRMSDRREAERGVPTSGSERVDVSVPFSPREVAELREILSIGPSPHAYTPTRVRVPPRHKMDAKTRAAFESLIQEIDVRLEAERSTGGTIRAK